MLKCKLKIIKTGGDKSSWSIIVLSRKHVAQINPPDGCSFRVKGTLDDFPIKFKSLLPLGDGRFLLPINAVMRKGTGKKAGDTLRIALELDTSKKRLSPEFVACLKDDPSAYAFFKTLNQSNQHYFNDWIVAAKAAETRTQRILLSIEALLKGKNYSEMQRSSKSVV